MARRFVMVLLGLGVIGGYGSAIAHLPCAQQWREAHRQQMLNDVATTCANSMLKAQQANNGYAQPVAQQAQDRDDDHGPPCARHRGNFWSFWRHNQPNSGQQPQQP